MNPRPGRVFWASIVLDTVREAGTPWVLYINARPATGAGVLAVDGPLRVQGVTPDQVTAAADEMLLALGWTRSTAWEQSIRGWVCWLQPADLEHASEFLRDAEELRTV